MPKIAPFDFEAHLLEPKKIPAEIRRRLSPDELIKIRKPLRQEYEQDGWELDTELKTALKMRRAKAPDVAFEDRVWAAMAKLNFTDLNADRNFRLPYGPGENDNKQIDVFAADDEVVLIIECRSTERVKTSSFKDELEATKGREKGIRQALRQRYPDHKVKFILATENYGVTKETKDRFDRADILHLDEEAIEYYLELANHLGKAARYQLLGNLFAGKKISRLDDVKVAAIEGTMGGETYYSFAIEPARLLKFAYVLHRNKANNDMVPTYQRLIKKARLTSVRNFVEDGGMFPNSIILNLDMGKRGHRFDPAGNQPGGAKLGVLTLPNQYKSAYVIDGQHRLYGYAGARNADKELIPVVAFVNLPRERQVELFMQINENQKAVPKNLRNTLNADLLWTSPNLDEQSRALRLRIAQHFGEQRTSPLFGRVIVGEDTRTSERCISIDALNNGLSRGNFIGSFTKTEMKQAGSFYKGNVEATMNVLLPFLEECFSYMKARMPDQWELGNSEGGFVFINVGVEALLRIFSDVVDYLKADGSIIPTNENAKQMLEYSKELLDPMTEYLLGLSAEDAEKFRKRYGSGGATQYWRDLQEAINAAVPGFNPEGLADYQKGQKKEHNASSWEIINDLEQYLNQEVKSALEDKFGEFWYDEGVPKKIRSEAALTRIDQNESRPKNEHLDDWDCLYLLDYFKIVTYQHDIWVEVFENRFTRPGEEKISGGWRKKASWMERMNEVRNDVSHNRAVTDEDFEFISGLREWLL